MQTILQTRQKNVPLPLSPSQSILHVTIQLIHIWLYDMVCLHPQNLPFKLSHNLIQVQQLVILSAYYNFSASVQLLQVISEMESPVQTFRGILKIFFIFKSNFVFLNNGYTACNQKAHQLFKNAKKPMCWGRIL
jgi:hypothetical protein